MLGDRNLSLRRLTAISAKLAPMAHSVELPVSFAAFDPDFCIPARQAAGDPEAVHLSELRALRMEALGGAAVAHRVRKVLLAGGPRPVSRREAEILFEIAETSCEGDSAPFAALFAAALMNHVLAGGRGDCGGTTLDRAGWLDVAVLDATSAGASVADVHAKVVTAALSEESVRSGEGWTARAASDSLLQGFRRAAKPDEHWALQRLRTRKRLATAAERLLGNAMSSFWTSETGPAVSKAA